METVNLIKLKEFSLSAYSNLETILNTYLLSLEALSIDGDFVECGVAAGAQVATMSYACQQYNINKTIHLYDSFEGIPLASKDDTEQPGIGKITHNIDVDNKDLLISSGITVHSIDNVKSNMKKWGINDKNFKYIKGWFQNTLPNNNIEKISLLRLDGDLYESTKVCLEYLYPKVVSGGYIIIDDYGLSGCKKVVHEYFGESLKFNIVDNTHTVIWFQKE